MAAELELERPKEPVSVEQVLATFNKHQGIVDAEGTIQWRHLRKVLQNINANVFSDEALEKLCAHAVPDGHIPSDPKTLIPLEAFLSYIFGAGDEAAQKLAAVLSAAVVAGELEPEVLRVRKANGDVQVMLRSKEVAGMQVSALKELVCSSMGKLACEVHLIANGKQMQDDDRLEPMIPSNEVLEVLVLTKELPQYDSNLPAAEQLPALKKMLFKEDQEECLRACTEVRRILSIERNPPIDDVIQAGLIPRLVDLASREDAYHLIFEAMWALTNVVSGTTDHTRIVVDSGAVPIFVRSLSSPNEEVREQAVWALGNIAGDSTEFRDLVIAAGTVPPLIEQLASTKLSLQRNSTWALSNITRGKPQPNFESVALALPGLARLLNQNDNEVLSDACWALSYLSDGANERIQRVIDAGVCPRLVELLSHNSVQVQTPALRAVGNIVTGYEEQTEAILRENALPRLHALLGHAKRGIRKETCWALSNILAGSRSQIQQVIEHALIPPLIGLMSHNEHDVQKEAVWAITNLAEGGSHHQVAFAVQSGCIPPLVAALARVDARVKSCAMAALARILEEGKIRQEDRGLASNPFAKMVKLAPQSRDLLSTYNLESADGSEQEAASRILAVLGLNWETERRKSGDAEHRHRGGAGGQGGSGSGSEDSSAGGSSDEEGAAEPAEDEGEEEEATSEGSGRRQAPPVDHPRVAKDNDAYSITVNITRGQACGLSMAGDVLTARCAEGTLLAAWNVDNPEAKVTDGDVLVGVGATRGGAKVLQPAIAGAEGETVLRFRRARVTLL